MSEPRVSIVLPCFDGAAHLDEAVGSVAAQTFEAWELVLVDDGSADATGDLMDAWAARDSRVRVVHQPANRGLPAALNEGFRHACGHLYTWTSDDNLYLPEAIQRMVERLDADRDVDLVYADYLRFDAAGGERRVYAPSTRQLALRNVVGPCFLYRREVHEEIGGFDEELFLAEDYDFWLRASTHFRFEAIPEVLYRYRDHASSLTSQRGVEAHLVAVRALDRFLPALTRTERAHALLGHAQDLFANGQARAARALMCRGVIESPAVALRRGHRRVLASSVFGYRIARHLTAAPIPSQPRPIRLLLSGRPGGAATALTSLAAARPPGGTPVELFWLEDDHVGRAHTAPDALHPVDRFARIPHRWPGENLFGVLRRIRRAVGRRRGMIVTNDLLGLAYAARFGGQDPLVQILHQNASMDYELAEAFEPFVDRFVTLSARIRDELIRRLPQRAADIRHLPCQNAFGASLHDLLADLAQRPIPHRPRFGRGPFRLDRPWLPNGAVRLARSLRRQPDPRGEATMSERERDSRAVQETLAKPDVHAQWETD